MSKQDASPLSRMLGGGEDFIVQGKKYKVKPLRLKQIDEFFSDALSIGPAFFNMSPDSKPKLDKWIKNQLFDSDDNPMTLEKVIEADWDLQDLKRFIGEVLDLSG